MGLFISYCRDCNNKLEWFKRPLYGFIQCRECGCFNSEKDLLYSLNDDKYWITIKRKLKIKKIINAT